MDTDLEAIRAVSHTHFTSHSTRLSSPLTPAHPLPLPRLDLVAPLAETHGRAAVAASRRCSLRCSQLQRWDGQRQRRLCRGGEGAGRGRAAPHNHVADPQPRRTRTTSVSPHPTSYAARSKLRAHALTNVCGRARSESDRVGEAGEGAQHRGTADAHGAERAVEGQGDRGSAHRRPRSGMPLLFAELVALVARRCSSERDPVTACRSRPPRRREEARAAPTRVEEARLSSVVLPTSSCPTRSETDAAMPGCARALFPVQPQEEPRRQRRRLLNRQGVSRRRPPQSHMCLCL